MVSSCFPGKIAGCLMDAGRSAISNLLPMHSILDSSGRDLAAARRHAASLAECSDFWSELFLLHQPHPSCFSCS
ncbi:hypothetical protein T10_7918 [Trichinella papuae]|uniref:Uncharacterized protein n=1 Tax=Trichinella papuae TaxID=268474 RepID=A0A0V1MHI3_9BILA|nr:hypothetical protein T10_7918 [Trichinella papuae]